LLRYEFNPRLGILRSPRIFWPWNINFLQYQS
jgi:hypothetical protein